MCKPYARQLYKFARYDKKRRKKLNKLTIYISEYGLGTLTLKACIGQPNLHASSCTYY